MNPIELKIQKQFLAQLQDPQLLDNEQKRRAFFDHPDFQPYFCLSYREFLQIWGLKFEEGIFPEKVTKWLLYTNIEWYNQIYNQSWAWKWYPLIAKAFYNTARARPTSLTLSLIYVASVDYLFDRYMLFQYMDDRNIIIHKLFDYNLCKRQNIINRQEYFKKYKEVISQSIELKRVDPDFAKKQFLFIVAGQRLNIYDPLFEWQTEKDKVKEERRQKFFVYQNQVILLYYRLKTLAISAYQGVKNASPESLKEDIVGLGSSFYKRLKIHRQQFPIYKSVLEAIPNRDTYMQFLEHDEINRDKLFYLRDELRLMISKVFNTAQYFISGRQEFKLRQFNLFSSNQFELQPQFRVEKYAYDFVLFSLFLIIPSRLAFGRQRLKQGLIDIDKYMRNQQINMIKFDKK